MPGAEAGRRFPALDPEPPPRSWWYRVGVGGAVLAVAVGLSVLGWTLSHRGRESSVGSGLPASVRAGRVLSFTEFGALIDSRPDGQDVRTLSSPNQFQLTDLPSVSANRDLVLFSDGRFLAVGSGAPTWRTGLGLQPNQLVPSESGFSAGDRDVVVLTEGPYLDESTSFDVSVVNAQTKASVPIGSGSHVAGDPLRPGAFVAVASPSEAVVGAKNPAVRDIELDLRDVGQPVVDLGSATSIGSDLGLDPSTPVALFPVPSPSGAQVAVQVVNLLEPEGSDAGLVVLDRKGDVLSIETPGLGPASDTLPAWSPDGTALVYSSEGPTGPVIESWTIGGILANRPIGSDAGSARCLWSPTGRAVLCDSPSALAGSARHNWNLAEAGSEASTDVPGPGYPIDWYQG